jgi:hypothetical protein
VGELPLSGWQYCHPNKQPCMQVTLISGKLLSAQSYQASFIPSIPMYAYKMNRLMDFFRSVSFSDTKSSAPPTS